MKYNVKAYEKNVSAEARVKGFFNALRRLRKLKKFHNLKYGYVIPYIRI